MGDYGLNNSLEYVELCVDSWDATVSGGQAFENSTSPTSQIIYSWPQYYFTSKKLQVAGFKVLSAEIPFVYDVITTANNTFVYTVSGVPTIITIPVGTYTGVQLASQLQTLLAAVSVGFTVTWSTQLLKFIFTQSGAVPWSFTFSTRQTAYSPLGFLPATTVTAVTGAGSQIVSPTVAQVTGPYYLYVNSRRIGSLINFNLTDNSASKGVGPELCRVPVNVQYGSVIFYNDPDANKYFDFFIGSQFDNIDFYLTLGSDQYQKPLDLKGSPWSLKLGLLCYRGAQSNLYEKPVSMSKAGGVTRIV
jgi:hypothetical protein